MRIERSMAVLLLAVGLGCSEGGDEGALGKPQLGEPVSESRIEAVEFSEFEQSTSAAEGDRLCAPCASNAECGAGNYCLRRLDGTRFCGRDCRSSICPTGYGCARLSTTVAQCVPPQADCTRVSTTSRDAGVRADAGADAAVDAAAPGSTQDAGATSPPSDAGAATGSVPNTAHCAAAAAWDPVWTGYEDEVLRLSNARRQLGATCGTTSYPAAAPLTMNPSLRCAARLHSRDMSLRGYFDHTSPEGVRFSQRITLAGYDWRTAGENIASGYRSAQAVVDGWMQSPGHCQNIMNASFREIGVGFYGNLWTQDFATAF